MDFSPVRVILQMEPGYFNINGKDARIQYKNHIIYDCAMYNIDDKEFLTTGIFTGTMNSPDRLHCNKPHPVWKMTEIKTKKVGITSYLKMHIGPVVMAARGLITRDTLTSRARCSNGSSWPYNTRLTSNDCGVSDVLRRLFLR
jgi:hypothetical protein